MFVFPTRYQIRYVNNELAEALRKGINEGSSISVRILDVTGGGWFRKRTYGVNIEIRLESDDASSGQRRKPREEARGTPDELAAIPSAQVGIPSPSRSLLPSVIGSLSTIGGTVYTLSATSK